MHLLSWHGGVMCMPNADGAITQQKLPLPAEAPRAMDFDAGKLAERGVLRHPELGLLRVEAGSVRGCVQLARNGRYICAEDSSPVVKFDRTEAGGWESWLPISAQDLADLQHILRFRWIVRETRRVIRRTAIRLGDAFLLKIGGYVLSLPDGLATAIAGRGGSGLPDRLLLTESEAAVELVIAEPRSSDLLETALWPVRSRRTAEIVTLAAHRFLTGLEPEQQVFERDTEFVQANRGVAALPDLLEQLDDAAKATPAQEAADPSRRDVLTAWAMRELTPWLMRPASASRMEHVYDELNATETWAFVYRIADGDVTIAPKPEAAMPDAAGLARAECYRDHFKAAARQLPGEFKTTLCVCVADGLPGDYGVPMFCFQKKPQETSILLPDIDFLLSDFHRHERFTDTIAYEAKIPTAVFAGSTTGGTVTPEIARTYGLPRLRAAKFFVGSGLVDFRLPGITQCTSEEAEEILKQNLFCRLPGLSWQEQLRHRFIISMDGNGATCSRVAIALHSNSVLMKYDSDNVLFYFGGLQPWVHYVPIAADRNVERIIGLAPRMPDMFKRIAAAGRAFAQTFLIEDAITYYTSLVLRLFADAVDGQMEGVAVPVAQSAGSAPEAAATTLVGHIQNRGDEQARINFWLGHVGSRLAIEGLYIALAEALPAEGFFYQAVLADGTLSEPAQSEEFCGTRSQNRPIYGFRITTEGRFAEMYDVTVEASFVDGSRVGPVGPGTVCKTDTHAALEALQLRIFARAAEEVSREAADSEA
jgi:hypothetical protein